MFIDILQHDALNRYVISPSMNRFTTENDQLHSKKSRNFNAEMHLYATIRWEIDVEFHRLRH